MNGPINKGVSSALPRVFSRRSAILKIVEEKALGTRLKSFHIEQLKPELNKQIEHVSLSWHF